MDLASQLAKFHALRELREVAVAENLEATKKEDAELRVNPRTKARLDRKKAEAEKYLAKQNAAAFGIDLERIQNLQYTAEEVEAWNKKLQEKKGRADTGFTDYNQLAFRKYEKKISRLEASGSKGPSSGKFDEADPDRVKALSEEIKADDLARQKFSKRRRFNEDEDVTYINLRNYRFNKKISRAYDKYTEELKDNLERGTAL
jgi:pre-mRNA-splicing factor SYF2